MTGDDISVNPSVLNTTVLSNFAYIDQLWVVAGLSGICAVPVVREELERGVDDHPYLHSALDTLDDEIPVPEEDEKTDAEELRFYTKNKRNRSLKDDEEVLKRLETAGIDRERVLSVDRSKVDEALEVTTLSESDVYDIEESEYVRKADVDEDVKESRLQGLKDRLAASDDDEAEHLRDEIEDLEKRIDDLTSFRTGTEMQG